MESLQASSKASQEKKLTLQRNSESCPLEIPSCLEEAGLLFFSGLQLMEEAHPQADGVCFTQVHLFSNVNLIQKYPKRSTENVCPKHKVPSDPAKLTHKINHHTHL